MLLVERNFQFRRKLVRVERAAGKKPFSHLDGRHFPAAGIHSQHDIFGVRFLININFREIYAALRRKLLSTTAIHTPTRAVNGDFFHMYFMASSTARSSFSEGSVRVPLKVRCYRALSDSWKIWI